MNKSLDDIIQKTLRDIKGDKPTTNEDISNEINKALDTLMHKGTNGIDVVEDIEKV